MRKGNNDLKLRANLETKKTEYFLHKNELHDQNLKRNIELALGKLQKGEELEQRCILANDCCIEMSRYNCNVRWKRRKHI